MVVRLTTYFTVVLLVCMPLLANAENWVEFHTEKWSQKSGRQNKKLHYSNRYFYDADGVVTTASGSITLWVKEVSDNDRYYVKKGVSQSETIFRQVHIWCTSKRYEVIEADTAESGANESLSEEIKSGSYYEWLHKAVCTSGSR